MALETEELALDSETCLRGVNSVFADETLGRYFVVEEESRVVGSLMITHEWSDWRCGTVWWIQSVYVEPSSRGKGVYRLMYEEVKSIVESDSSLRGIRLYVDRRNSAAQRVYERLGMNGDHYKLYEWMKS